MSDTVCGDRVSLTYEGSTFTDDGVLISEGEIGYVVAHKGFSEVVVHWDAGVGIAERSVLAVINARSRQKRVG